MIPERTPAEVPDVETWPQAIEQFSAWMHKREKAKTTIATYLPELEAYSAWHLGKYEEAPDPRAISEEGLRAWKEFLLDAELRPATINKKLSALGAFARWAESKGICRRVERPIPVAQEEGAIRWLTENEEHALLRAVRDGGVIRDIALVGLLLNTGIRVSEAAELQSKKVQMTDRKGQVEILGKGRKLRWIPLNLAARKALESLRAISPAWGQPGHYVFEGPNGGLTEATLWRNLKRYEHSSKIDHLTTHSLRHTFCRRYMDNGGSLVECAKLAGHESLDTTRRYVEAGEVDLRRGVERMPGGARDEEDRVPRPRPTHAGRPPRARR
jgi:site-specific recombinase XerD